MCGRFRLSAEKQVVADAFDVEPPGEWAPRYNIAPTDTVPVVRQHRKEPHRELIPMRWGLVPSWAKDINMGVRLINARADSLAEKPAFKDALRTRRCLVPTNGFYEWKKSAVSAAGKKQPFHFGMTDDSVFALAGLWERWKQPQATDWLLSFTIITTDANQLMQEVHDRMPAIIAPENYDRWLDPGFYNHEDLMEMLRPYPAGLMKRYEVSPRVGSVKNDDPECAEPYERRDLFGG